MAEITQTGGQDPAVDPRAAYIRGLELLAGVLRDNPDVPLPMTGGGSLPITFGAYPWRTDDPRGFAATIIRALPCHWEKGASEKYFTANGILAGLRVQVIAQRDDVCERVVVGTETVTKQVPDPAVEVPLVEVTETREIVEWQCGSILAGAVESASGGAA